MTYPSLNEFKSFINGVGFPIVTCLILFYTNAVMIDKQNQLLSSLQIAISENSKEIVINRQSATENGKLIAMLVAEYRKECKQ